jgi:glycosyltransferase involved in cell wall biosynthesis
VIINYAMDENHPIFSHQVQAVSAISQFFREVTVITGSLGSFTVPSNVRVVNTNWITGNVIGSLIRFLGAASKHIFKTDVVVFSHMTEVQSALIAPITRLLGIPHYLWYAHQSRSRYLLWCYRLLDGIITSSPGSCPVSGKKVRAIGQGVDPRYFLPEDTRPNFKNYPLIHFGRFDPSKNVLEIIEVCESFISRGLNLTLTQVGSPSTIEYEKIAEDVKLKYHSKEWLTFLPSMPRQELSGLLSKSYAMIHAYRGSLDKTLIEATMQRVPVVTINEEYLEIFGCWSTSQVLSLESELESVMSLNPKALSSELLRRQTIALHSHSLTHWSRLVAETLNQN